MIAGFSNFFCRRSSLARDVRAIANQLLALDTKVNTIMVSAQDFQNDLDAIKVLVQKQADAIAVLSAAAPGVMTQEQLDALDAEAKAILATTASAQADGSAQ